MLKCVILLISSILKKVAVTLTQLHAREEKNKSFLHFCLRTYITLLVLKHARKRRKNTFAYDRILSYWFKYIIVLH